MANSDQEIFLEKDEFDMLQCPAETRVFRIQVNQFWPKQFLFIYYHRLVTLTIHCSL